jgi:tyrosine-protein phosphatase SIW14
MNKTKVALKYFAMTILLINSTFAQTLKQTKTPKASTAKWASLIQTKSLKNLYKVNSDLYRSEQPQENAGNTLKKLGIKSILSLKQQNKDKEYLGKHSFEYYSVEMESEDFDNDEIIKALRKIKDAPKPILVHCKHGSDRTGVVIAMYRIVFENWTKAEAINEMKNGTFGFKIKYENIIAYINNANIEKIKKKILKEK